MRGGLFNHLASFRRNLVGLQGAISSSEPIPDRNRTLAFVAIVIEDLGAFDQRRCVAGRRENATGRRIHRHLEGQVKVNMRVVGDRQHLDTGLLGNHRLEIDFDNGHSDLWKAVGTPRRLAELGLGKSEKLFDLKNGRLIVWYADGRAYLLDLNWLVSMNGDSATLSPKELVQFACEGPFATRLFDERVLKAYMGERQPQVCIR